LDRPSSLDIPLVRHHKVRLTAPFYLGIAEVTQEQCEKVMGGEERGVVHFFWKSRQVGRTAAVMDVPL
jgi:hypothetical protein